MQNLKKIIFLLLLATTHIAPASTWVKDLYAKVLGQEDASLAYQAQVRKALADFEIPNPKKVPVKKMNPVGPKFAGTGLSSFTACGIWLNEEALDECSQSEKTFNLYHEAAHYANSDHKKLVAQCLLLGAGIGVVGYRESGYLLELESKWGKLGIAVLAGISSIALLLPTLSRIQEQQADEQATRVLCTAGKAAIVADHIKALEAEAQANDNQPSGWRDWWYSATEQVGYLRAVYDANK